MLQSDFIKSKLDQNRHDSKCPITLTKLRIKLKMDSLSSKSILDETNNRFMSRVPTCRDHLIMTRKLNKYVVSHF